MAPMNQEQLGLLRDERREQIKKAALKVFARRGLTGTKMSMIAAEAGISQGLSYRYFESKEVLFVELVQDAMAESHAAVDRVVQLRITPREQLRALTVSMLEEGNQEAFLLVQLVQTSDEVPEAARQVVERSSSKSIVDRLVPLFTRGQRSGELRPGNPRRMLFCYLAVLTGLMLQRLPRTGDFRMPELELLLELVVTPQKTA